MAEAQSTIEYRDIPGIPDYRIGSDGSVWSRRAKGRKHAKGPWKKLRLGVHNYGYHYIAIRVVPGGRQKLYYVHRLVLETFSGPCPEGMEARHDPDPNPANNAISNLKWGTPKENSEDRIRHGHQPRGSRVYGAKLTDDDIKEIFKLRSKGLLHRQIARRFGVAHGTVADALARKTWKHVVCV